MSTAAAMLLEEDVVDGDHAHPDAPEYVVGDYSGSSWTLDGMLRRIEIGCAILLPLAGIDLGVHLGCYASNQPMSDTILLGYLGAGIAAEIVIVLVWTALNAGIRSLFGSFRGRSGT